MNENRAKKLVKKVESDYDKIADHFSNTRKYLWPEMKEWQGYIKNGQKISAKFRKNTLRNFLLMNCHHFRNIHGLHCFY